MKTLASLTMVVVLSFVMAACGSGGKSASPPAGGITVVARDRSAIVSWAPDSGVDYWLFFATSSDLTSTNANTLPGGKIVPHVSSPVTVSGLTNGTTYYFTMNGRTGVGPGGSEAAVVSATPRLAGNSWSAGTAAGTNDLRAVAFGAQFSAVGANGVIFSSANGGITWTSISPVVASNLNALIYSGGYVAAGAAGVVLTSSDGQTWNIQNSGTTNSLSALASNGATTVVAVGGNGTIINGVNAVTWTASTSGTTQNLNGVTYGNGVFVAVGAAGVLLSSADGITWTPVTSGTPLDLNGIVFVSAASLALNGITSSIGEFVAVGAAGTIVTSPDGVTWTPQAKIGTNNLTAVTFGTQFVAVGSGGVIFSSLDGVTWTPVTSGTGSNLTAVISGNNGYVTVGALGTNLTAY